jgi:glycosyltransferase involved in cell wall biosynthesis
LKNIDLIAYKIEAYDSDDFIQDISSKGLSYLIMIFDPHHGYHIISNVGEIQEEKTKLVAGALTKKYHWIFYALLYPITFLIDYYIVSKKINQLVDRYNPTNAFVDNTFVALHFSRLRKKSKIKNLVYGSHDWFDVEKVSFSLSSFLKYCFSYLFLVFDYQACRNSDIVLNHTEIVGKKRLNHWGKNIIKNKEYFYKPNLTPILSKNFDQKKSNNKIIFLGWATSSSGLKLTLDSIKGSNYELNIIGKPSEAVKSIKNENNISNFKHLGFLDRSKFSEAFDQCIAGINIITSEDVHTVHTVPSKVIDYLRHGVPVICTKNIGPFSEIISEYNLGLIIEPNNHAIIKAINEINANKTFFSENIKIFFNEYPFSNLFEYFEYSQKK